MFAKLKLPICCIPSDYSDHGHTIGVAIQHDAEIQGPTDKSRRLDSQERTRGVLGHGEQPDPIA
eukprot:12918115-Prorocentrum_lima.AAC.1